MLFWFWYYSAISTQSVPLKLIWCSLNLKSLFSGGVTLQDWLNEHESSFNYILQVELIVRALPSHNIQVWTPTNFKDPLKEIA